MTEGARQKCEESYFSSGFISWFSKTAPKPEPGSPSLDFHMFFPAAGRGHWDDLEYRKPGSRMAGVDQNWRQL